MKIFIDFFSQIKTQKYIYSVLFLLSLYLFIRLFFLTWYFGFPGGGGGWIGSLGSFPVVGFHFHWNIFLGGVGLLSLYFLYRYVRKSKQDWKKKYLCSILVFLYALLSWLLFDILSPQVSFELTKTPEDVYVDKNGKVDLDVYIDYMTKYCNPPLYTCSEQIITKFDTVEDYIKLLEAFKNNNNRRRYDGIFGSAEYYGFLPELIEKYNDKTFYVRIISGKWNQQKLLDFIKQKTGDEDILNLIIFVEQKFKEYNERKESGENIYWPYFVEDTSKMIDQMIDQMNGVNPRVL